MNSSSAVSSIQQNDTTTSQKQKIIQGFTVDFTTHTATRVITCEVDGVKKNYSIIVICPSNIKDNADVDNFLKKFDPESDTIIKTVGLVDKLTKPDKNSIFTFKLDDSNNVKFSKQTIKNEEGGKIKTINHYTDKLQKLNNDLKDQENIKDPTKMNELLEKISATEKRIEAINQINELLKTLFKNTHAHANPNTHNQSSNQNEEIESPMNFEIENDNTEKLTEFTNENLNTYLSNNINSVKVEELHKKFEIDVENSDHVNILKDLAFNKINKGIDVVGEIDQYKFKDLDIIKEIIIHQIEKKVTINDYTSLNNVINPKDEIHNKILLDIANKYSKIDSTRIFINNTGLILTSNKELDNADLLMSNDNYDLVKLKKSSMFGQLHINTIHGEIKELVVHLGNDTAKIIELAKNRSAASYPLENDINNYSLTFEEKVNFLKDEFNQAKSFKNNEKMIEIAHTLAKIPPEKNVRETEIKLCLISAATDNDGDVNLALLSNYITERVSAGYDVISEIDSYFTIDLSLNSTDLLQRIKKIYEAQILKGTTIKDFYPCFKIMIDANIGVEDLINSIHNIPIDQKFKILMYQFDQAQSVDKKDFIVFEINKLRRFTGSEEQVNKLIKYRIERGRNLKNLPELLIKLHQSNSTVSLKPLIVSLFDKCIDLKEQDDESIKKLIKITGIKIVDVNDSKNKTALTSLILLTQSEDKLHAFNLKDLREFKEFATKENRIGEFNNMSPDFLENVIDNNITDQDYINSFITIIDKVNISEILKAKLTSKGYEIKDSQGLSNGITSALLGISNLISPEAKKNITKEAIYSYIDDTEIKDIKDLNISQLENTLKFDDKNANDVSILKQLIAIKFKDGIKADDFSGIKSTIIVLMILDVKFSNKEKITVAKDLSFIWNCIGKANKDTSDPLIKDWFKTHGLI